MKTSSFSYQRMTKNAAPPSKIGWDCLRAFLSGGAVCVLGQLLFQLYRQLPLPESDIRAVVSITLVGASALLTALHLYQKFAVFAGAGSLVPITGFANAMVATAMEYKPEGHILGIGAKLFTIAGPVLLYGTFASALYGIGLWLLSVIA